MEDKSEKKVQAISMVLIVVAVAIAIAGYFYVGGKGKPKSKASEPSQAARANASSCPVTDLGSLLQVEIAKGQTRTANGGNGVGIETAEAGGLGSTSGLQSRDVVVAINDSAVTCPKDLLSAVQESLPEGMTLHIEREGKPIEIAIPAQPATATQ